MSRMNKAVMIVIFACLFLAGLSAIRSVLADVPQIRNVVVYQDGSDTKLNVTVYHFEEILGDYVDLLKVVVTTGTPNVSQTFPQSGPHTLDPMTHTFNVTLDIGQINDAPLAQVQAHCVSHGWSTENWTGTVPEYSFPLLLLAFSMTALALLVKHRAGRKLLA
jgi:hypothetical protein